APRAVSAFGQIFVGHEQKTVLSIVNTLVKQRNIHGHGTVTRPIANLRDALAKLEACLRSAEAKKAADDIGKLVELLEGCWQADVDELVTDARGWLLKATEKKPSAASRRKGDAAPALPPVDYAALLSQSAKDNAGFDQVVARLRADRKIKKADMRDIARQFLGYELAKKRGREDALTEIIQQ